MSTTKDRTLTILALLEARFEQRPDNFMALINALDADEHQGMDQTLFELLAALIQKDAERQGVTVAQWIAKTRENTLAAPDPE